ncbi:MarR family winged helix-turn-helix transcriptional regulator [Leptospira kirschneri]|uniref:Sugar-specific transcriptional regulator, TrmB family n=1 Tax=Leptospira kirschneri str. 200802841 TaxID=1193047 RepID=A0A828Y8U0_9LEPT|nr:MarR family winged helix-turn-helix transcriptional regulator [Leptospira kirschneri]EMO77380.1 sugar-specific transcriptional regulator, TrmB family [Leptospira kirschneri str. 200801925]EJO69831.1 MarR family protein [Leptospira kirschneri serovar Grippotyphosa str. RM52]EKO53657.1 sugar-specific transcriptional regulator, TrmB family [Leptospira kirschneri str. 200802841]EKR08789.1 MarR family protein [Leptospira kirschneri serovar Valbuzzi str. 200702274]EMN03646.1 sugar-specific transc
MSPRMVIYLISRIRDEFHKHLNQELKEKNLSPLTTSHADILFALVKKNKAQMQDIAKMINRDKSTLTALVDKLEVLGLVVRTKDSEDQRIIHLELTPKADSVRPVLLGISRSLLGNLYRGFTESEKKELVRLLMKLYQNQNPESVTVDLLQ